MGELNVRFGNPLVRAQEIGGTHELRFFEAFQAPQWRPPYWFRLLRKATREEDKSGVDAFAKIDVATVPLQIKSSVTGLLSDVAHYGSMCHFKKGAHCIIIVTDDMTPEGIRRYAIDKLFVWRGMLIRDGRSKR